MENRINSYFKTLEAGLQKTIYTDATGSVLPRDKVYEAVIPALGDVHARGNKIMFIGNGGSAGICSHMAIDYSKNGNLRSTAFNDGAALTCLGNDLGYDQVFAKQIDLHAREGDLLMAISSSGKSANILNAVKVARERGCMVYSFSGFGADNPLRTMGHLNAYVDSMEYGFVEISHLALIHSFLDLRMGWGKDNA